MKLMKVEFIEWRDPPTKNRLADSEIEIATRRVAEAGQRELAVRSELIEVKELLTVAETRALLDRRESLLRQLDTSLQARRSALYAESAAATDAIHSMKSHARVGTFGYQVLDDELTEMAELVDADGNSLPEGAVYGYRIVDQAPPAPTWAGAKEVT